MIRQISKWVIVDDCEQFVAKCSICGHIEDSRLVGEIPRCPKCGAKMRNEKNIQNIIVKQYVVLRKDAPTCTGEPVSAAKLAAMAAHASSAFLLRHVLASAKLQFREVQFPLDPELESWALGDYVKVLLGAKTKDFLKIPEKAAALGFRENNDFFCVRDICRTELLPDEGKTTCFVAIGFRPMGEEKIKPLVKRLQLY